LIRLVTGARYQEFDKDATPAPVMAEKPEAAPPQMVGLPDLDADDISIDASSEQGTPNSAAASASTADPSALPRIANGRTKQDEAEGSSQASSQASQQSPQFPVRSLAAFAAVWALVLVCIFLRGGKATKGAVEFCSMGYWLIAVVTAAGLALIGMIFTGMALNSQETSPAESSPSSQSELVWTRQSAQLIVGWSLIAGTMAAMCGIGGGMIMGPKLLDLGVLPQVQSATTATTLFVMSSTTAITFLVQGSAPVDYAFFLAFMTGVGAIFGKIIIGWVVKKFRRPSFIIFLLGGIILASVIVMSITGLIDVINDIKHGRNLSFKGFCSASDEL